MQIEAAECSAEFGESATTPSTLNLRGIASILADIYQGAENAFQRIAKITREGVPSGPDWHVGLLDQMSHVVQGSRPAVIQAETRTALEEFRAFRHKVRHLYGFDLDWDQLRPVLDKADEAITALVADLEAFCEWLDQLGEAEK